MYVVDKLEKKWFLIWKLCFKDCCVMYVLIILEGIELMDIIFF